MAVDRLDFLSKHLRPVAIREVKKTKDSIHQDPDRGHVLTWEDSYAIALALQQRFPQVDLEQVSLYMIYQWAIILPEFVDDPELANEAILSAIYQEWFEEVNPL